MIFMVRFGVKIDENGGFYRKNEKGRKQFLNREI